MSIEDRISQNQKSIADSLGVDVIISQVMATNELAPTKPVEPPDPDEIEREKDFQTARKNITNLVDTTQTAVDGLMELAVSSEEPRAYEVLSDLIKTGLEANRSLMDLHKVRKNEKTISAGGPKTVNNTINVGSTAELLALVKDKKKSSGSKQPDENVTKNE